MPKNLAQLACAYHAQKKPGKLATQITKPCTTQNDLSLAYTPGVGLVCLAIAQDKRKADLYTNKANFVAVLSDGSAVLGLGDIGPLASYPVMEGKGVLFKKFADIDVAPICLNSRNAQGKIDVKKVLTIASSLEPTFGGINLEDIKAPECFAIEEKLKAQLKIPVFHDDQHGTAIIVLAALLNSLQLAQKKISQIKCVFVGAGAACLATAELFLAAGAQKENLTLIDSQGIIYAGRSKLNLYKKKFALKTKKRTLAQAIQGADVFIGVSRRDLLTPDLVQSMAPKAIIFALANPWPEILPKVAQKAGGFIVGTGRSDFPNQINNVLGFPGIFRGALDTHAREINTAMKLAAAKALAALAQEKIPFPVQKILQKAYPKEMAGKKINFSQPLQPNFILPKPLDPRVVPRVARAVVTAAFQTKVNQVPKFDLAAYEKAVAKRTKN